MSRYAQQGLLPFMARWREYDMLRDQPVTLLLPQQQRAGIARGINELGALQFESEGKIESIFAGEVSLRLR
jgi:BirA family biotin operon repressor/biotin-[acetyl-CoA-carboxylase] ligase